MECLPVTVTFIVDRKEQIILSVTHSENFFCSKSKCELICHQSTSPNRMAMKLHELIWCTRCIKPNTIDATESIQSTFDHNTNIVCWKKIDTNKVFYLSLHVWEKLASIAGGIRVDGHIYWKYLTEKCLETAIPICM